MSKEIIDTVAELLGEDPTTFASEFIVKQEGSDEETVKETYKEDLKAKVKARLDEVYAKGKSEATSSIIPAEQYLAGVLKNAEGLQETPTLDAKSLSDAVKRIQDVAVKKAVEELKSKLPNENELQKQYNELLSENGKVTDEAKQLKITIEAIKSEKEKAIADAKAEVIAEFTQKIAYQENIKQVGSILQSIINENVEVSNPDAHATYSRVAIKEFMELYDLKVVDGKLVAYQKGTDKLAQRDYRDINVIDEAKKHFLHPAYGFNTKKTGGVTPNPNGEGGDHTTTPKYTFPTTHDAAVTLLQQLMVSPAKDFNKISALNAHIQKLS